MTTPNVFYSEDFFSQESLDAIDNGEFIPLGYVDDSQHGLTSRFKTELESAAIYAELMSVIHSTEILELSKEAVDLAWRYVCNGLIAGCDIELSLYHPGAGFAWHVDHWSVSKALVWMCTLRGDACLEFSTDAFPTIGEGFEPSSVTSVHLKRNRLIVMPSYYPHRVVVVGDEPRASLHGYFHV